MECKIYLYSRIDILFTDAAFADQTYCRAFALVAKTMAMLLRLNEYVQKWLC